MTIRNILDSKKVLFSFEIFPPKKQANFDNVISCAKELSALEPDFMSIIVACIGNLDGSLYASSIDLDVHRSVVELCV